MDLYPFFKGVLEQEVTEVILCNLRHEIVYMNPAAKKKYEKHGGEGLLGKSLLDCHSPAACEKIREVVARFASDSSCNRVYTFYNVKQNKDVYMVALRGDRGELIGYYEKHELRGREERKFYSFD